MKPPMTDKTVQLHDGRTLGYAEYGDPNGKPIFYFHGHPGSRLEARFLALPATQAGVRLIGVDRPGMGLSSYKANRRLLDWPDDMIELADTLNIPTFSLVGFSGGGPYLAACAYRIPNRHLNCGVVSGVGHVGVFLSFLSQWLPWLILPLTKRNFQNVDQAQRTLERFSGRLVEPDRQSLFQPDVKEIMASSLVEAMHQGTRGAAYDGMLLGQSWGFKLDEIAVPAIYLWHGELDTSIPIATARKLVSSIPNCKATYYPEGHISLIVNHGKEIMQSLTNDRLI